MELTKKSKIIIVGIIVVTAFAFGRYSTPEHVKIVTKTIEVEKKQDISKTDDRAIKKKKIFIHEVKTPDGRQDKTTTITDDTDTTSKTDVVTNDTNSKQSESSKEITRGDKVTISALAGVNPFTAAQSPGQSFTYGLAATKPLIGPITIGAFGFSDGLIGASLGLTF